MKREERLRLRQRGNRVCEVGAWPAPLFASRAPGLGGARRAALQPIMGSRMMPNDHPPQRKPEASAAFEMRLRKQGFTVPGTWTTGYVDHLWRFSRHTCRQLLDWAPGNRTLEFGCNLGAGAILLAALGADVDGVDIDAEAVELSRLNAAQYEGPASSPRFTHVSDTRRLPFPDQAFDFISCNSVLEYVDHRLLPGVLRELDRVLAPGGVIGIHGTSSRLWPREVHSRRWLVNYLPRFIDSWAGFPDGIQRGVLPWQLRHGFGPGYEDLVRKEIAVYLQCRAKESWSPGLCRAARLVQALLHLAGLSIGWLQPNICLFMRKPGQLAGDRS